MLFLREIFNKNIDPKLTINNYTLNYILQVSEMITQCIYVTLK
jgi:hypothetical protein